MALASLPAAASGALTEGITLPPILKIGREDVGEVSVVGVEAPVVEFRLDRRPVTSPVNLKLAMAPTRNGGVPSRSVPFGDVIVLENVRGR